MEKDLPHRLVIAAGDGGDDMLSASSEPSLLDSSAVISAVDSQTETINTTQTFHADGVNRTILTATDANLNYKKCINKLSMLFSTEGHVFLVDPAFRPKLSSRGQEAASDYGVCDAV